MESMRLLTLTGIRELGLEKRSGMRARYSRGISVPAPTTDMAKCRLNVRFSNRPFGVKHFQTIRPCGVDVARGLVLLFGIGTKALPSWVSKTRWNNLSGGLAVERRQVQADIRTHLIQSSREGHLSTAGWSSKCSPIGFDPEWFSCCRRGLLPGPTELGAVNPDAVHDHGQPASQGHDRLFHPAAPGDLHGPRLEP
jgi:hypothetical protein